jgi:Spy/CpxP family protein refolding chaperone
MTKIRSTLFALVVAASATVAATAGAQSSAPANGQRIERSKSDSTRWKGEGRGERKGGKMGRSALRGVNPTDAQKTQIKSIHEKYQTQYQSFRTSMKPAMDEAKAARQRGDTTAARAALAKTAATRQQAQALRDRETAEIRAILTPAQQQTFDANVAKAKAQGDKMRGERGERGEHGDHGKRRAS